MINKNHNCDYMEIIIPTWFYGFDSVMYLICAAIGFLLSYYFHKIYSISSEKKHVYIDLGFLLLSIGFLTLAITDVYSYITFAKCLVSSHNCVLGLVDEVFGLEDFSYFLYFGLSISAYILFITAFTRVEFKFLKYLLLALVGYIILIVSFMPIKEDIDLWITYHNYFHMTALIMMIFISFKNFVYYSERRSLNSLLVAVSFSFISLFHLFHLFSFVSEWMYVFAHISLLTGFLILLMMVLRVKKK